MSFNIVYHNLVIESDIPKLSTTDKDRIKQAVNNKLVNEPETFGRPLRRSLRGYRKLRVGDYRIVFRIEKNTVKIFYIGHRSIVYKKISNRI